MYRKGLCGRLQPVIVILIVMLPVFVLVLVPGCTRPVNTVTGHVIQVVAAENFWGSIAVQLGGEHINVTTIINNPNVDPHEYQSTTADARAFAAANVVILNGAGYDTWGQKLLDANPVSGRKVLNVADLLGKKEGDNPHFWYDPDYVARVVTQITSDYQSLDPEYTSYFAGQQTAFNNSLSQYHQLIASINQTYGGTKVGATENIFVYLAGALGLDLISPPAFMNAVAEGNDPPAAAVAQFQQQIMQKQIAMLAYNVQTVNVITTNMKQMAAGNGIPAVGISETVTPAGATFQDWQINQLLAIQTALKSGG